MTKLYLSVPIDGGLDANSPAEVRPTQAVAKDYEEHSRIGDAINALRGKREVEADPKRLEAQVTDYIAMVRSVVSKPEPEGGTLKINSVKLGLTVTVGGNIGLASAKGEASIEIEFTRDG